MMKIYIDDVRFPPSKDRHGIFPDLCKSSGLIYAVVDYMAVICYGMASELLTPDNDKVEEISFDHDLGDDSIATGYTLLRRTIETYLLAGKPLPKITIHSANPIGAERMQRLLEEYNQRR